MGHCLLYRRDHNLPISLPVNLVSHVQVLNWAGSFGGVDQGARRNTLIEYDGLVLDLFPQIEVTTEGIPRDEMDVGVFGQPVLACWCIPTDQRVGQVWSPGGNLNRPGLLDDSLRCDDQRGEMDLGQCREGNRCLACTGDEEAPGTRVGVKVPNGLTLILVQPWVQGVVRNRCDIQSKLELVQRVDQRFPHATGEKAHKIPS